MPSFSTLTLTVFSLLILGCSTSPDSGETSNPMSAANRAKVGRGVSYSPEEVDATTLAADMKLRRDHAWKIFEKLNAPVTIGSESIPLWQTWYDQEEFSRIFKQLISKMTPEQIAKRAPFAEAEIQNAMDTVGSSRTPLRWQAVESKMRKESPAFAGFGFELYSPDFLIHYFRNYAAVERCSSAFLAGWPAEKVPSDLTNLSPCFGAEFPKSAVMLKTVWIAEGDSIGVYDSSAAGLTSMLNQNSWMPLKSVSTQDLEPSQIFTLTDELGKRFHLAAFHVVTKEVREWAWATFFWSQSPNSDLGQDRPSTIKNEIANYKMCTAAAFNENDPHPDSHYAAQPQLASALRAVKKQLHDSSWCADPFLENSFPRTNCMGCHQGAPLAFKAITRKERENFPADFSWSFSTMQSWIESELRP